MSDIKEKIAKQLMGSKTGLLSSTLAERLTIEKSIINDALEAMRQIQDVKKGSKSGLDNYRWTMTDMGRLNYRVDESPLTQTEKTPVETPQAAQIVAESPLEQKQDTTSNMFDWTDDEVDNFAKVVTGITPDKVKELFEAVHDAELEMEGYVVSNWIRENQPSPQVVGLSDEMVADFWKHSKCRDGRTAFIQSYKNWEKTQTFAQLSEAADVEIEELRFEHDEAIKVVGSHTKTIIGLEKERDELQNKCQKLESDLKVVKKALQFNWDDAPDDAVRTQIVCNFLDAKGIPLVRSYLICEEERPKPKVEVGQIWKNDMEEVRVIEFGRRNSDETVCFKDVDTDFINQFITSDFLAKFERVS